MQKKIGFVVGLAVLVVAGFFVWKHWFATPAIPADSLATLQQEKSEPTTVYTPDDLKKHAAKTDCWVAISGSVYDVTSFIPSHPGGNAIAQACGTDGTALFASVPDHERQDAKTALDASYRIGDLAQ